MSTIIAIVIIFCILLVIFVGLFCYGLGGRDEARYNLLILKLKERNKR